MRRHVLTVLSALCLAAPIRLVADPARPAGMAGRLVEKFRMQLVPDEGVWFALTYLSAEHIEGGALPPRYAKRPHALGNAIVALATRRDFSAMHRLKSDETWHFYGGAPLELLVLHPDGHGSKVILGPNVFAGEVPQFTVPHDAWQGAIPAAVPTITYSFFGTQLSPAFDYEDFELGDRERLTHQYPRWAAEILRLTRSAADRPPG